MALALPLVVWLLSRRPAQPLPVPVGTFALWQRSPPSAANERSRRRVPPARWLAILGLLFGALALGGPRRADSDRPETWRVVVDRSPSMYLEYRPEGPPFAAGETRLEVAAARLERWLAERADVAWVEWVSPPAVQRAADSQRGLRLPASWREPPSWSHGSPAWERFDEPGVLWLTDRVPAFVPRSAGLFASGGATVPGPVSSVGRDLLVWDGDSIERRSDALAVRTVAVGEGVPEPIASFARLWAQERGLRGDGDARGAALRVERRSLQAGATPARDFVVSHEGWTLRGRTSGGPPERASGRAPARSWLRSAAGEDALELVVWGPGFVLLDFERVEEPEGDAAFFALSWSRLLDGALLPAAGVVALEERGSAGTSRARAPVGRRLEGNAPEPPAWPAVAILTGVAAAFALAAFGARLRSAHRP